MTILLARPTDETSAPDPTQRVQAHRAALELIAAHQLPADRRDWSRAAAQARAWAYRAWDAVVEALATDPLSVAEAGTVLAAFLHARPDTHQVTRLAAAITQPDTATALAAALTRTRRYPSAAVDLLANEALPPPQRAPLANHLLTHARGTLKRHAHRLTRDQLTELGDAGTAITALTNPHWALPDTLQDALTQDRAQADAAARRVLSLLAAHPEHSRAALVLAHPAAATSPRLRARLARAAARVLAGPWPERLNYPSTRRDHQRALRLTTLAGRAPAVTDLTLGGLDGDELALWARLSHAHDATLAAVLAELAGHPDNTVTTVLSAVDAADPHALDRHAPVVATALAPLATETLTWLGDRPRPGSRVVRRPTRGTATAAGTKTSALVVAARDLLRVRAVAGDAAAFAALEPLFGERWRLADEETTALPWSALRPTRRHLLRPVLLAAHTMAGSAGVQAALQVEETHPGTLAELELALGCALRAA